MHYKLKNIARLQPRSYCHCKKIQTHTYTKMAIQQYEALPIHCCVGIMGITARTADPCTITLPMLSLVHKFSPYCGKRPTGNDFLMNFSFTTIQVTLKIFLIFLPIKNHTEGFVTVPLQAALILSLKDHYCLSSKILRSSIIIDSSALVCISPAQVRLCHIQKQQDKDQGSVLFKLSCWRKDCQLVFARYEW